MPQAPEIRTETVAVTGQSFTRAWRATSLQHVVNPWNVQLSAQTTAPVRKGDVLVVQFWVRAVGSTGTARTEFVMELAGEPYDKVRVVEVQAGPTWTLHQVPFQAGRDFAAGKAAVRFRLGYDRQALELGGVVLKDYGNRNASEFPAPRVSKSGQKGVSGGLQS